MPTNRQAHEEAAGMGLEDAFFTMNGIDPDAEATPDHVTGDDAFTTTITMSPADWSAPSAEQVLANMRDSIQRCRDAAARPYSAPPITVPAALGDAVVDMLRGESLAEALRAVLKMKSRRNRKGRRRRTKAAMELRRKLSEHYRGLEK